MKAIFASLALACASVAVAAPPPAPVLSVGVTDIRQLEFAWEPVVGAQSYELWFRAAPGAEWVKYREQPAQRAPLFRVGVAVHLLDWRQAQYYVNACNYGGCTASNLVGVDGLQLDAMGFVKPNGVGNNAYFGNNVAVAADGKTFVAMSAERIGTTRFTATLHVYRRTSAIAGWRREARLLPSAVVPNSGASEGGPYSGEPLAISGDGNVLALSVAGETIGSVEYAGAVYIFRRTGTTWTQTQKLSRLQANDNFGLAIKLDDAGRTLAVLHGQQPDRLLGTLPRGTLAVYRDAENDGSDQFLPSASVPVPPNPFHGDPLACMQLGMSGDGQTIVRGCRWERFGRQLVQVLRAPGWTQVADLRPRWLVSGVETDFNGTTVVAEWEGVAEVWKDSPQGWQLEAELNGAFFRNPDFDHRHIALSRDGKLLALGVGSEYTQGIGPVYPPYVAGDQERATGTVTIFERKPSGWRLRRVLKAGSANRGAFGHAVGFGDNGRLLIVGAPLDPSAATGIDGDRDDDSAPGRGAVWIF